MPDQPVTVNRGRDMLDEIRRAEVSLYVRLPGSTAPLRYTITLGEQMAEALDPLPRERELVFCRDAQHRAIMMTEHRRRAARHIAEQLTDFLMDKFTARDPIKGYSPEEWAQINQQPSEPCESPTTK